VNEYPSDGTVDSTKGRQSVEGTQRTAHASTQTLGLGLITATFIVVVALTFILFDAEDVGMFAVLMVLTGGATFLTWRFDTQWARAVGLVATILALAGFFLAFGVFQLFSPIEFVFGLTYVLGFFLALVAGIRALFASRKDRTGPSIRESRTTSVVLGIIGVAALVSISGYFLTRQTVPDAEAAGSTEVKMAKFEFDPETTDVAAGTTLLIKNTDPYAHDFTVEELGISEPVRPGGEVLVDLADAPPGTYTYVCTLHSDGGEGMVGTITIEG